MSSVTKGLVLRVLAAAKRDSLSLLELHFDRGNIRSRMRAVAEWLCPGSSASTPIDHTRPDLHHIGTSLRNDDLIGHVLLLKACEAQNVRRAFLAAVSPLPLYEFDHYWHRHKTHVILHESQSRNERQSYLQRRGAPCAPSGVNQM